MALSYEEAREIVLREVAPNWGLGTFCLDDREITEDDEVYVFTVGAREYIVDGDESYLTVGGALPVVHKADGKLESMPWAALLQVRPNLRTQPNPNPTLRISASF